MLKHSNETSTANMIHILILNQETNVLPNMSSNNTCSSFEVKPPFSINIKDKETVKVTNPFTKKSCLLSPIQTAVYDKIIGSELSREGHFDEELNKIVRDGKQWFRDYYPTQYCILLDSVEMPVTE